MKANAIERKTVSPSSSRRYRYTKVKDNRKAEVRGLWRRNSSYYARITVTDDFGRASLKWVPLEKATSDATAVTEFRTLLVEREKGELRPIGLAPLFADAAATYVERQKTGGKKADTLTTENAHVNRWIKALGALRVDKIHAHHITAHLHALRKAKKSARTCNLSLTILRNVFKLAKQDKHLKHSPADGLEWFKVSKKERRLYSPDEIDRLIEAVNRAAEDGVALKNAPQFGDYLRFLQYTGAREQESLRVGWGDVDFAGGHITIGAEGDAKNWEFRKVDLNPQLAGLLQSMKNRKAPDSQWLFPSPQRGEKDEHSKTFRESLKLAREAAQLPKFGFHDMRHFFASRAVMSGIDFMTISKWLGHKDGGILVAKTYGHLADEHKKAMSQRLIFSPVIVGEVAQNT